MMEQVTFLNRDERKQFVEAFEENLDLLLDLIEVVGSESANADDILAAEFMTGLSHLVRVFRQSRQLRSHDALGQSSPATRPYDVSNSGDFPGFMLTETN